MDKSFEKDLSGKSDEQVMFAANETLMKSKACFLCCVMPDGAVEYIKATRNLNPMERLGLYNYMLRKITAFVNAEFPTLRREGNGGKKMDSDDSPTRPT